MMKKLLLFLFIFTITEISTKPFRRTKHACHNLKLMNQKIRLYSICSSTHEILKNNYFLPSIKDRFEIIITNFEQISPTGIFMEDRWRDTMLVKVDTIIKAINNNPNKVFIYSDVDIQFFKPFAYLIKKLIGVNDIVFQREHDKVACAGFFIAKGNKRTLALWKNVRKFMQKNELTGDQRPLNYILFRNDNNSNLDNFVFEDKVELSKLKWDYLPDTFVGGATIWKKNIWKPDKNFPIDKNIIMHHANCTIGVGNKIKQLEYVKNKMD